MDETTDNTKTNTYEQEPTYSLYKELPSILLEEAKNNRIPFISYNDNLGKYSDDNLGKYSDNCSDNYNDNYNDGNKTFYKKLFYFFLFVFIFYMVYKLFLESNDKVLTSGGEVGGNLVKINELIPSTDVAVSVAKIDELINVTDLIEVSDIPIKINGVFPNTKFSLKMNPNINPNIDQIAQLFDAFKL